MRRAYHAYDSQITSTALLKGSGAMGLLASFKRKRQLNAAKEALCTIVIQQAMAGLPSFSTLLEDDRQILANITFDYPGGFTRALTRFFSQGAGSFSRRITLIGYLIEVIRMSNAALQGTSDQQLAELSARFAINPMISCDELPALIDPASASAVRMMEAILDQHKPHPAKMQELVTAVESISTDKCGPMTRAAARDFLGLKILSKLN